MAFLWHKEGVTAPICVKLFFLVKICVKLTHFGGRKYTLPYVNKIYLQFQI